MTRETYVLLIANLIILRVKVITTKRVETTITTTTIDIEYYYNYNCIVS